MQESFLAFAVYVLTTNFLLSVFQKDVYIFMKRKRNLEKLHCKCIHFRFRILIYKMVLPTTLMRSTEKMKKKALLSILSFITFSVFLTSGIFADPLKLDVKEYVLKNGLKLL